MAGVGHAGSVKQRLVVIVAFPGLQSLDAVGPYEVFAGAGRAARFVGRTGDYQVSLVSTEGGALSAGSGLGLWTAPLPGPDQPIDTLLLPGGDQAQTARGDDE